MRLSYERQALRLGVPFASAHGTVGEREVVRVKLLDDEGAAGFGEAAPLWSYDGVGLARVERALERYGAVLKDASHLDGAQIVDACRLVDDLPQAFAAVEIALWDRAGRRAGKPVCALLTDTPVAHVPVNATLATLDRATAAERAAEAVAAGFGCLKLKVGLGDDAGRVAAVRAAAGPDVALRLDANGAWDVEQAVRAIEALAPAGLELVEEPVHGLAAMREVRARVATRVSIDETAAEHGALTAGVADAVCLKISRCGGISGLLAAAALVRASGAEAYVASTLDGPLGVAAALHAAAALASRGPLPACGLATLGMFEGLEDVLSPVEGQIAVPEVEGLGVGPQLT